MSNQNSMFKNMMNQYESSKPKASTPKISESDRLKKYFSTWIPDDVKAQDKIIRILPPLQGETTPFINIKAHSYQVNGKWEKYICPEFAEGKACPFCEARTELLKSGDDSDKKIAKNYSERDMYVLRVIERGKEEDGVKFWRFNRDFTNNGVFDKIISVVKLLGEEEDITSVENGFDLVISINRNQNNQPSVVGIQAVRKSTPLTDNAELTAKIMENTETWRDVYSIKSYDYLSLIVEGKTPVWSSEAKTFVSKEDADSNLAASNSATDNNVAKLMDKKNSNIQITSIVGGSNANEDDDVPF